MFFFSDAAEGDLFAHIIGEWTGRGIYLIEEEKIKKKILFLFSRKQGILNKWGGVWSFAKIYTPGWCTVVFHRSYKMEVWNERFLYSVIIGGGGVNY